MIDVQLLKHRTDSARHYLQLAEAQDNDVLDRAELQYSLPDRGPLRNFRKATDHIHRYIYLTDSLTCSTMQVSAGITGRVFPGTIRLCRIPDEEPHLLGNHRYLRHIHPRRNSRLYHPPAPAHPARTQRPLPAAGGRARAEYRALTRQLEGRQNTEKRLKSLVASRFDILDKLGKTYYERENTSSQQAAMFPGSKTDNHRLLGKQ